MNLTKLDYPGNFVLLEDLNIYFWQKIKTLLKIAINRLETATGLLCWMQANQTHLFISNRCFLASSFPNKVERFFQCYILQTHVHSSLSNTDFEYWVIILSLLLHKLLAPTPNTASKPLSTQFQLQNNNPESVRE